MSLNFCIHFLLLVNGPHAHYESRGYLKCISGMNVSTASKILFIISFILYPQNKTEPNMGT